MTYDPDGTGVIDVTPFRTQRLAGAYGNTIGVQHSALLPGHNTLSVC